jgi:hypothetical protein
MCLKRTPVSEPLFHTPDHGIFGLCNRERKATWLRHSQSNMFWKEFPDDIDLVCGCTNQVPNKANSAHLVVRSVALFHFVTAFFLTFRPLWHVRQQKSCSTRGFPVFGEENRPILR